MKLLRDTGNRSSYTEKALRHPRKTKPRAYAAMIHSVSINGYRCFSSFEMTGLGRVNLLVGTNNSGKTSVLEALSLLASNGDPSSLWGIVSRRGERILLDAPSRQTEPEFDLSHLFYGHELRLGAMFSVSAKNQAPERSMKFLIGEAKEGNDRTQPKPEGAISPSLVLKVDGSPKPLMASIPLTRRGGIRLESVDLGRRGQRQLNLDAGQVQFISTESLSFDQLAFMWNKIALTDAQERVVKALRFLDEKVEAIAPNIPEPYYYSGSRGGFIVKLKGVEQPIPIGSLGDGIWRILALAIALSRAKDGILLVDEIDTGLHYTVMADMWKLIAETSKALNVQVFATTHSFDCVYSLATICQSETTENSNVTLHRVDSAKKKSVPFSEAEISQAAQRHIEVR